MVGDNYIQSEFACRFDSFMICTAAVHGDDQGDTLSMQSLKSFPVETVTFMKTVRYVPTYCPIQGGKEMNQQRGGSNTVHVIVAVDSYLLSLL